MKKEKFKFWLPKKRLFRSGNAEYTICFPTRVMRAFGWQTNEEVELFITSEEIRIVKANNNKKEG